MITIPGGTPRSLDSGPTAIPVGTSVGRRTLVAASAWSIPALALAVAAPAAAASTTPEPCPEQRKALTATSMFYNVVSGGPIDTAPDGSNVFGPDQPLFADLTVRNTGDATVTSVQSAVSLEMVPNGDGSNSRPTMVLYLPDGSILEPVASLDKYDQDGLGLRWVWTFAFSGFAWAPGESYVFRSAWSTTGVAGVADVESSPYSVASPTQISCNGEPQEITPAQIDESSGLSTSNRYYVRT